MEKGHGTVLGILMTILQHFFLVIHIIFDF